MTRALSFIVAAMLAGACAGTANVQYATPVTTSAPELVTIAPEVDVVLDAREPVFRTNNAYWLYRDDRWYRSDDLRGTWVRIVSPPRALAAIDNPRRYANYRPDSRTVYHQDLRTPRPRIPQAPPTQAPYPRPPQQEPPALPEDQVPDEPTPPLPDDFSRPDRMRDR